MYLHRVIEIAKKTGKQIPTIVDDFPDAKIVTASEDVWKLGHFKRGDAIDELLENNLGHNYKTYDIIETTGTATSIKSIDPKCSSYRTAGGLRGRLKKYVDDLLNGADTVTCKDLNDGKPIDVKKRVLNLAFPDVPLTSTQKEVIDEFFREAEERGFELVITIVKT